MKPRFESPDFHVVPLCGATGAELAAMSDAELEAYLRNERVQAERKCYRMSGAFPMRMIAGEAVIIPTKEIGGRRADMGMPNETFRFLAELFARPRTVQDVILAAKEAYDDPAGALEADIRRYVAECLEAGMLEEVV